MIRKYFIALALMGLVGPVLHGQTPTLSLSGTVTDSMGRRLPNAVASLTRAPEWTTLQDTTDALGSFRFVAPRGSGDFLLVVSLDGYASFRQRLVTGDTLLLAVIVRLSSIPPLPTVEIVAKPTRPPRREGIAAEIGDSETFTGGVVGVSSPTEEGDIGAAAGTLPGFFRNGTSVSTLGLPGTQSQFTLNGLATGPISLPRDLHYTTRVSTTTYDPARGGFAGALLAVDMTPGTNFTYRRTSMALLPPIDAYGNQFSNEPVPAAAVLLSGAAEGAIVYDRVFYSVAAQVSRSDANPSTLTNLGRASAKSRVDSAIASKVLEAAHLLNIPTRANESRIGVTENLSIAGRLDWSRSANSSLGMAGTVGALSTTGEGLRLNEAPSTALRAKSLSSNMQVFATGFARSRILYDFRAGLSVIATSETPVTAFPAVSIQDTTSMGMGPAPVVFSVGGALQPGRDVQEVGLDAVQSASWMANSSRRVTVSLGGRAEGTRVTPVGTDYGSFFFSSFSEFKGNTAANYQRSLERFGAKESRSQEFVAISSSSGADTRLQIVSGVRADLYTSRLPAERTPNGYSEGLERARNLSIWDISPRGGFSLRLAERQQAPPFQQNALGSFISVPSGVLRGGVGRFVGRPPSSQSGSLASRDLSCLGSFPIGDTFNSFQGFDPLLPEACIDGSAVQAITLSDGFAPGFRPPYSWRASLNLSSSRGPINYTVDGVASFNRSQPSLRDVNLSGTPKFVLPIELRPVFADVAAIDEQTGTVLLSSSRRDPALGRVIEHVSELTSVSERVTLTMALAQAAVPRSQLSVAYSWGQAIGQNSGITIPAYGLPEEKVKSSLAFDHRHQVVVQAGHIFGKGISLTLFLNGVSGSPFTPIVAGDVNGDGTNNDRAFVFSPNSFAAVGDAGVYGELVQHAPGYIRKCITQQLDRVAGLNSCRSPWSVYSNLRISRNMEFGQFPGTVSLNVSNPARIIGRVFHSNELRDWGRDSYPDQTLYYVGGFNRNTKQFRYIPNPNFGLSQSQFGNASSGSVLTIDVRVNVSVAEESQLLARFLSTGPNPSRPRLSKEALKGRYAQLVPGIYQEILEEADSLLLTKSQIAALEHSNGPYAARLDSLWEGLSIYLTNLDNHYNPSDALRRVNATTDSAWAISQGQASTIKTILSPTQIQLLPFIPLLLVTSSEPVRIRIRKY